MFDVPTMFKIKKERKTALFTLTEVHSIKDVAALCHLQKGTGGKKNDSDKKKRSVCVLACK